MKVMMFAMMSEQAAATPPSDELMTAMHNFNLELEKAGVLVSLGGLMPTSHSVRVKYKGKKRTVIDGPFTEAKEVVAGYSLLEVKDMAEAIEWAKKSPFGMDGSDGEAEVQLRPLFDPSMFDPPAGA
jgi:hypothetical protein